MAWEGFKMMRSSKLAALVAVAALAGLSVQVANGDAPPRPRGKAPRNAPRRYVSTAMTDEMRAWNDAVDAKKAARKRARWGQ